MLIGDTADAIAAHVREILVILRSRLDSADPLRALRPHTIGRRSVRPCARCTAERGEGGLNERFAAQALCDAHLPEHTGSQQPRTMLLLINEGCNRAFAISGRTSRTWTSMDASSPPR